MLTAVPERNGGSEYEECHQPTKLDGALYTIRRTQSQGHKANSESQYLGNLEPAIRGDGN